MDITDIQQCADYFKANYIDTFYLITTYNRRSFFLIGDKENFPHLIGISRKVYRSNGYNRAGVLFNDILARNPVNNRVIPNRISQTSKMYKKVLNFQNSADIFWGNAGPLAVDFNPALSNSNLNNVDLLLTDIQRGYMLGWKHSATINVSGAASIKRYCISSWIDENAGSVTSREKYLPSQDVELIRHIFAFNSSSELVKQKEYSYDRNAKKSILQICSRRGCNLLMDSRNTTYYKEIAISDSIHCKINGIQY